VSLSKALSILTCGLFVIIFFTALVKKKNNSTSTAQSLVIAESMPLEIFPTDLHFDRFEEEEQIEQLATSSENEEYAYQSADVDLYTKKLASERFNELGCMEIDNIDPLFSTHGVKYPFVEPVTYHNKVGWKKNGPAWISDYASHYGTSRHFIARGLNKEKNYIKQDVRNGDQFNVFSLDKKIEFHLVIDILTCRMWFYAYEEGSQDRYLLKIYTISLGKVDPTSISGLKTPLGKYSLGDKIAVYRPKVKAFYNGKMTEMISVFGTRWIPFAKEVGTCTAAARGLGIHGVPYEQDAKGNLTEDTSSIGGYASDGCIRLKTEDVEELFAIIITKPTTVHLVKGFQAAQLPGKEASI
jgi:hypothetical protein